MAFIPTPNAAVATLVYEVSGREVTNDFAFEAAAPMDTAALADLCSAIRNNWEELLVGIFTNVFTLTKIKAVAQDSDTAPFFELLVTSGNVGTGTGTPLSLNVCMNVGLYTTLRGRSYRGNIKHPSTITEHLATKRQWDDGYRSFIATAYADFFAAVHADVDVGVDHVVISRQTDGAPRSAGVATPVAFYSAQPRVGTISRRTT